jgi:hypothetical protein
VGVVGSSPIEPTNEDVSHCFCAVNTRCQAIRRPLKKALIEMSVEE